MVQPIERLRATVERADGEDPNDIAGNMRAEREADSSAVRILRFLTSDGADEEVARALRARKFERTGRVNTIGKMDPPTENELDDARALLSLIAQKGMGE